MHLQALVMWAALTCACFGDDAGLDAQTRAVEEGPVVTASQVEQRDGVYFLRGNLEPFTGKIVEFDPLVHFAHTDVFKGVEVWPNEEINIEETPEEWPEIAEDTVYARAVRDYVAAHGHCHDTLLLYCGFGAEQDIPALLAKFQKLDAIPPAPGGGRVCTHAHCVDALERAAGGSKGKTYAEWAEWWAARKRASVKPDVLSESPPEPSDAADVDGG